MDSDPYKKFELDPDPYLSKEWALHPHISPKYRSVSKTQLYLNSGLQPDMDPDPCAKQELDPDPCKDYRDLQQGRPPVCVTWIHASQQNRCLSAFHAN